MFLHSSKDIENSFSQWETSPSLRNCLPVEVRTGAGHIVHADGGSAQTNLHDLGRHPAVSVPRGHSAVAEKNYPALHRYTAAVPGTCGTAVVRTDWDKKVKQ